MNTRVRMRLFFFQASLLGWLHAWPGNDSSLRTAGSQPASPSRSNELTVVSCITGSVTGLPRAVTRGWLPARDTRPPAGPAGVEPRGVQSLAAHATQRPWGAIFSRLGRPHNERGASAHYVRIYSYDVRRGGKAYGLPCGSGLSVQCSTAALGALRVEVEVHKARVQRTHCRRGDYFHTTPRPSTTAAPTCTRCNLRTCVPP